MSLLKMLTLNFRSTLSRQSLNTSLVTEGWGFSRTSRITSPSQLMNLTAGLLPEQLKKLQNKLYYVEKKATPSFWGEQMMHGSDIQFSANYPRPRCALKACSPTCCRPRRVIPQGTEGKNNKTSVIPSHAGRFGRDLFIAWLQSRLFWQPGLSTLPSGWQWGKALLQTGPKPQSKPLNTRKSLTYSRDSSYYFTKFQFVQDSSLSCSIQTNHEDPHFFFAKEAFEEVCENISHGWDMFSLASEVWRRETTASLVSYQRCALSRAQPQEPQAIQTPRDTPTRAQGLFPTWSFQHVLLFSLFSCAFLEEETPSTAWIPSHSNSFLPPEPWGSALWTQSEHNCFH